MSNSKLFSFTKGQKQIIKDKLNNKYFDKKYKESINFFIRESERVIGDWQSMWTSHGKTTMNERLDKIEELMRIAKAAERLQDVLGEYSHSDDFWQWWQNNPYSQGLPSRDEVYFTLNAIESQARTTAQSGWGNEKKPCERDFVSEIACQYRRAFRSRPSSSRNGNFAVVVREMASFVCLPDGSEMVIGGSLLSSEIDRLQSSWDYEDQCLTLSKQHTEQTD